MRKSLAISGFGLLALFFAVGQSLGAAVPASASLAISVIDKAVQSPACPAPTGKNEGGTRQRGRCVRGFSKDACDARFEVTHNTSLNFNGCPDTPDLPGCRTLTATDLEIRSSITSSSGVCVPAHIPEACDKFRGINALRGSFSFDLDLTPNDCFYKGCWSGKFSFYNTFAIAPILEGEGHGVLGVGSHRRGCEDSDRPCHLTDCENCRDVEFIPSAFDPAVGLWRIGLEGFIEGDVLDGPQAGADACLMIQGDLFARGTRDGGIDDFRNGFDFCGTVDGVTVLKCE